MWMFFWYFLSECSYIFQNIFMLLVGILCILLKLLFFYVFRIFFLIIHVCLDICSLYCLIRIQYFLNLFYEYIVLYDYDWCFVCFVRYFCMWTRFYELTCVKHWILRVGYVLAPPIRRRWFGAAVSAPDISAPGPFGARTFFFDSFFCSYVVSVCRSLRSR